MKYIGFTGHRGCGKSTLTKYVCNRYSAVSGHIFGPGKAMVVSYLKYIGVPRTIAAQMVHGDLKDTPSEYLPNGVSCRYFMEKFGHFMGTEMGPEWTMGGEIKSLSHYHEEEDVEAVVFESVVYEADYFKNLDDSFIIRVDRDSDIVGDKTDAAVKSIVPDYVIDNNGSLEDTYKVLDAILLSRGLEKRS